ncbi:MAG: hypothetical protein DRO09_00425 [Thermoprotei archaeon]|nr:MAG: hypothetical protein DRO09_00425 [Thermoprotei archaeon]
MIGEEAMSGGNSAELVPSEEEVEEWIYDYVMRHIRLFHSRVLRFLSEEERHIVTRVFFRAVKNYRGRKWLQFLRYPSAAAAWVLTAYVLYPCKVPLSYVRSAKMRGRLGFVSVLNRLGLTIRENPRIINCVDMLGVPQHIREEAIRLIVELWDEERDRVGLAAAAVYYAALKNGCYITQSRVAAVFGITTIRLRKVLRRQGWHTIVKRGRKRKHHTEQA